MAIWTSLDGRWHMTADTARALGLPPAGATRAADTGAQMRAERAEFDRRKEITRFHESGHAVAARALGLEVTGLSVDRNLLDADTCGLTVFSYPPGTDPEDIAVTALAGAAAGRCAPGWRSGDDLGSADDEGRACLALRVASVPAHVRREAEDLVARHRDGIARLAGELLRRRTVLGDEVGAIMAGPLRSESRARPGSVTVNHVRRSHVHHGDRCAPDCRWQAAGYAA